MDFIEWTHCHVDQEKVSDFHEIREISFEVNDNFRSQLKQAVAKMVQECCKWITEGTLSSKDVEVELINTLRTVTEGKIYVEVERARLTHRLAKMKVNK